MTTPTAAEPHPTAPVTGNGAGGGLARSAGILGLGNVASRVIGLLREAVISGYFGSSGELSAFNLAARVPTMIYDLLVGGMLSAALVPVFSEYAKPERRDELGSVASTVFSLIAIAMALIVLLVEIFAAPLANILGNFDDPALQAVLTSSLRFVAPAVLVFGLSGAVTGLLYALRRFSYTALSGALFNLGIVLAAPLLAHTLGVYALAIGVVGGSLMQLAVLAPGVRGVPLGVRPAWRGRGWRHPAVRRILILYAPIAAGLIITQIQIIVDGRWASMTGAQSVSWMRYATTLIQLPLGLVPVAVSLAALPTLSRHAVDHDWDGFRSVFGRGLRMVIVLLIPAAIGLWVLAAPVVRLLFEHGSFLPSDTAMTSLALRCYLIGLPFAGVDFLLNYTFYARQNTRSPAIVGVIAVGIYFVVALALRGPLGFIGLVLADSAKQAGHAAIMTVLLLRGVGRLHRERILSTLGRVAAAGLLMGVVVYGMATRLIAVLPQGFVGEALVVAIAGGLGGLLYLLALRMLRVPEVSAVTGLLAARFVRRRRAN
jgi:putative peptidoglycan lipid II flippase